MNSCKNIELDTKKAWELNWSKVAKKAISEIFDYPRVKKLIEIYIKYLPKNGLILEAGCGLGQWVGYFCSKGYRAVGIDYNVSTIRQAKSYDATLGLAAADVRMLPLNSDSIDSYVSFGVIEHFPEGPDAVLKEAYRVLKKGGTAIITVPHKNIFIAVKSPIERLKRSNILRKIFLKEKKVYYYQKYFTVRELISKFLTLRYKVITHKPVDHIFSLVEFSGVFRDKASFDGENELAVKLGNILEKVMPIACAGSNLFILQK